MEHHFNIEIAKEYGMLGAVLLNNILFWVEHNRANNTNFHDGCYWTYNSTAALAELFPYATSRQISYALKKLKEAGLIKTGNYNKSAYDRTLWYTLTEKGKSILQQRTIHLTNLSNGNTTVVEPIPDIKPDKKPNIKQDKVLTQKSLECAKRLRDKILNVYPNNLGARKKDCIERWAVDIDKMNRIDGRSWENIEQAIDWALDDPFWQKNIWSGKNLRKYYDRLEAEARANFLKRGILTVGT